MIFAAQGMTPRPNERINRPVATYRNYEALFGGSEQGLSAALGLTCLLYGLVGDIAQFLHLFGNFVDQWGKLFGRKSDPLDARRDFLRGLCDGRRKLPISCSGIR